MAVNGRSFSKGWDAQRSPVILEHPWGTSAKMVETPLSLLGNDMYINVFPKYVCIFIYVYLGYAQAIYINICKYLVGFSILHTVCECAYLFWTYWISISTISTGAGIWFCERWANDFLWGWFLIWILNYTGSQSNPQNPWNMLFCFTAWISQKPWTKMPRPWYYHILTRGHGWFCPPSQSLGEITTRQKGSFLEELDCIHSIRDVIN